MLARLSAPNSPKCTLCHQHGKSLYITYEICQSVVLVFVHNF